MLRPFRGAWLCMLVSLGAAVYGQTGQGTLTGSVADTSGAVAAGAAVVVRNQNTGFVYNAVSTTRKESTACLT